MTPVASSVAVLVALIVGVLVVEKFLQLVGVCIQRIFRRLWGK